MENAPHLKKKSSSASSKNRSTSSEPSPSHSSTPVSNTSTKSSRKNNVKIETPKVESIQKVEKVEKKRELRSTKKEETPRPSTSSLKKEVKSLEPTKSEKTAIQVKTKTPQPKISKSNENQSSNVNQRSLRSSTKIVEKEELPIPSRSGRKAVTVKEKVEIESSKLEEIPQVNNVNTERKIRKSTPLRTNPSISNNNNDLSDELSNISKMKEKLIKLSSSIPQEMRINPTPRELILKSHRPHLASGMLSLSGNYGADLNELLWDFVLSIDCPEIHTHKNAATCHVCLGKIDPSHSTAILSCPHIFHSTCLESLESVNTEEPQCPICLREELKEKEKKNREERRQLLEKLKEKEERLRKEEVRLMEKELEEREKEERLKIVNAQKDSNERKRLEKLKNEIIAKNNNSNNNNNNTKGNGRGRKREASTSSSVESEDLPFTKIEGKSRRNNSHNRKKHRSTSTH